MNVCYFYVERKTATKEGFFCLLDDGYWPDWISSWLSAKRIHHNALSTRGFIFFLLAFFEFLFFSYTFSSSHCEPPKNFNFLIFTTIRCARDYPRSIGAGRGFALQTEAGFSFEKGLFPNFIPGNLILVSRFDQSRHLGAVETPSASLLRDSCVPAQIIVTALTKRPQQKFSERSFYYRVLFEFTTDTADRIDHG